MGLPEKMKRMHNIIWVCVDGTDKGLIEGKFYHLYSKEAVEFRDIHVLLERGSKLMDELKFPEETVRTRSFKKAEPNRPELIGDGNKVLTIEEMFNQKGLKGTFAITVVSRHNASWQGDIYSIEKDKLEAFNSDIELINIINNNLF